jgi:FkbM family methyltransferase
MRDEPLPYKISYAQNREDILLEGMLKNVEKGFYVDIGANHPVKDSVTKLFYDKGWMGINVEPSPVLFAKVASARPRDINLNIGVGDKKEKKIFRFYKNGDGLSTFSLDMMNDYETQSDEHTNTYEDSEIEIDTLKSIFTRHPVKDVHFIKIDVEGFEYEVLHGNDWKRFRPWVICIEATHIKKDWDEYIKANNYIPLFFDGLNQYYIAEEHKEIIDNFSYAFTIFPTPILTLQAHRFVEGQQKTIRKLVHIDNERAHFIGEINRLQHEIDKISGVKGSVKNAARAVDRAALVYIDKLNKPRLTKVPDIDVSGLAKLSDVRKAVRLHDMEAFYTNNSGERVAFKAVSSTYRTLTRVPVRGLKKVKRTIQARRRK